MVSLVGYVYAYMCRHMCMCVLADVEARGHPQVLFGSIPFLRHGLWPRTHQAG